MPNSRPSKYYVTYNILIYMTDFSTSFKKVLCYDNLTLKINQRKNKHTMRTE